MADIMFRPTAPSDSAALMRLCRAAFPTEDLTGLLAQLLDGTCDVVSLTATLDDEIAGHVLFTPCDTVAAGRAGALLGPLAVDPDHHGQGIGTKLVRHGLSHLADAGLRQVFVLGDPGYYGRFGFGSEDGVQPPYPLPPEWAGAWQSVQTPGNAPLEPGALRLPSPWMQPALWQP